MAIDNVIAFPTGDTPDPFSSGGFRRVGEVAAEIVSDPLVALGAEWQRLNKEGERLTTAQDDALLAGRRDESRAISKMVSETWDRVGEVEQQMTGLTATTPEGLAAQARTLRDYVALDESERMLEQILVGLAKLTDDARINVADRHRRSMSDAAIVTLFREWIETQRAAEAGLDRSESEFDALMDRLTDLERQIAGTSSDGPSGLAVKVYLAAWHEYGGHVDDPASLSQFAAGAGEGRIDTLLSLTMLRDAARYVPEIATLIALVA